MGLFVIREERLARPENQIEEEESPNKSTVSFIRCSARAIIGPHFHDNTVGQNTFTRSKVHATLQSL